MTVSLYPKCHQHQHQHHHHHSIHIHMKVEKESIRKRVEAFLKSKLSRLSKEIDCFSLSHLPTNNRIPILNREEILIGDFIGKGSFSEVYEVSGFCQGTKNELHSVENSITNRFVIKHLHKEISIGQKQHHKASLSLITEATWLARIDHPHIIKLRACASTGTFSYGSRTYDSFCLILDRLDLTLAEKIGQWKRNQKELLMDPLNFLDRLCYAMEIADALEYLHERRLVHRDLKPENVGFKNNSIQLFDFGLCRELPDLSHAHGKNEQYHMTYAGTFQYTAPEVHSREGYNLKADVYSWAMVFYELISLKQPFKGLDNKECHQRVCCEGERPDLYELDLPVDVEELLRQSWATLGDRLSMVEVCDSLEDIITCMEPQVNEKPAWVGTDVDLTELTLSFISWNSSDSIDD